MLLYTVSLRQCIHFAHAERVSQIDSKWHSVNTILVRCQLSQCASQRFWEIQEIVLTILWLKLQMANFFGSIYNF